MKYIIKKSIGLTAAALLLAATGISPHDPTGEMAMFDSLDTTSVSLDEKLLTLGGVTRLAPTDPDKISGFKELKIEYLNEHGQDFARVQVFAYALE